MSVIYVQSPFCHLRMWLSWFKPGSSTSPGILDDLQVNVDSDKYVKAMATTEMARMMTTMMKEGRRTTETPHNNSDHCVITSYLNNNIIIITSYYFQPIICMQQDC